MTLLFSENDFVPRVTIVLRIEWHGLALISVMDLELGWCLDLLRQTFDTRFAFIVRADREVELMEAHETVLDLDADLGVVDSFSRRVSYHEIRSASPRPAFYNRNIRAVRRLRPRERARCEDKNRRN